MQLRVLFRTLFMVGLVEFLALISARHFSLYALTAEIPAPPLTPFQFLMIFFIVTTIMLVVMKIYRGQLLYRLFFYLLIAVGLINVFTTIFPWWVIPIIVSLFIIAMIGTPYVWVHNLTIGISAAGVGPVFGLQMDWQTASIILIILSLYDLFAVYGTRHMVAMAYRMLETHTIFGLIIPQDARGYHARLESVRPGAGFLILGGGDLVIPMLLTSSLAVNHVPSAIGAVIGILAGLTANHFVLIKQQQPLPALPLIAIGTILGALAGFYV